MCCRTLVTPLDPEIARTVLLVGMFAPVGEDVFARRIEEEGTTVTARFEPNALRLEISPSITSLEGHNGKRITAGVYFEIASRYAEKVDGVISQLSNVQACADANGGGQNVSVAHYPDNPLNWENVCMGFAQVILGNHVHDEYEDVAY